MTRLALLLLLVLPACSDGGAAGPGLSPGADALPAGAAPLDAEGTPLRVLDDAAPGPEGDDPACTAFAPAATCSRVGDVTWVSQADGGSWQLTSYARDGQRGRWVPELQGSGGGLPPTVSEVDLTDAGQPEALVVYGAGFDVVTSGREGLQVVVHGEGQASVEDGAVVAGDREVRQLGDRWVSVPAG